MIENTILEKKHYYMQILSNADLLRKNAEVENAEDLLSAQQLDEVFGIWKYTFVGLLREGLIYDYIKNNNNDESKDIVRLTLDNVQFDCPVPALKAILKEDYDKLIIPTNNVVVEDFSILSTKKENISTNDKTKSELALERELSNIKKKSSEEIEKLSYEANHDAATGVKNKRAFLDLSNTLTDNYILISLDINNLKQINDTLGHIAGDKIILTIAKELIKHFPHCIYRIGGDEFVIVIKEHIPLSAIEDKFVAIKETLDELNKTEDIICSFAYGISAYESGKTFSEILEAADKAMYANKREIKQSLLKNNSVNEKETVNIPEGVNEEKTTVEAKTVKAEEAEYEQQVEVVEVINYNNKFEKIKDISTFVYDIYDLSILPPGASDGEKIKALVSPLCMAENDTHPEIMVMLTGITGESETYVSKDGLSSIKLKFNENELLIRGSFANGEFQSYIMPAGVTMSMGFNINKNSINEKRSKSKELTSYGHIVFEQFGYIFHIVPTSLDNDENGIAHCFICVENKLTKKRDLLKTSTKNFTVYSADDGIFYQILTYWQDNILCAEVIKA